MWFCETFGPFAFETIPAQPCAFSPFLLTRNTSSLAQSYASSLPSCRQHDLGPALSIFLLPPIRHVGCDLLLPVNVFSFLTGKSRCWSTDATDAWTLSCLHNLQLARHVGSIRVINRSTDLSKFGCYQSLSSACLLGTQSSSPICVFSLPDFSYLAQ